MIKPQDAVLLLKLFLLQKPCSQAQLGRDLFISTSEVNAGIKRLTRSHLITLKDGQWCVDKNALQEFLVYALPYVFPAKRGEPVKGILIMPSFHTTTTSGEAPDRYLMPVWPMEQGPDFGFSLLPLYPSVPKSAAKDQSLYQWLAIADTLRDWQSPHKRQAADWVDVKIRGKRAKPLKSSSYQNPANEQQLALL